MIKFIIICILIFIAGAVVTAYYCHTMGDEMPMPGGWNMSMMWMRMPGQTWLSAIISFMFMWLAMMVAIMMPSAMPIFIKTSRKWPSPLYIAAGYFMIWLLAGLVFYFIGMVFSDVAMRSNAISRIIPLLAGTFLIAAGVIQFTKWKLRRLLCCRSHFGCAALNPREQTNFRLGCAQGIACCQCCVSLMIAQLILGIMNPLAMVSVAIAIAAEKLFPRPALTVRIVGVIVIITGISVLI